MASPEVRADDHLYTSNAYGEGAPGIRLEIDTKTVGTYTDVPCAKNPLDLNWSPNGASWGIARNRDFSASNDYIWASISTTSSALCSATSDDCMGVARLDVSTGGYTMHYTDNWNFSTAAVPDVAANAPSVVALDKRDLGLSPAAGEGSVQQWVTSTSTTREIDGYNHLSQIEWVGSSGNFYAFTVANTEASGSGCECTYAGCASKGSIGIGKFGSTDVEIAEVPRPPGVPDTWFTKPEGISVTAIDSSASASCSSGATHVIYVADYCLSQLHVYTTDTTQTKPTPIHETSLDLNSSSSWSESCRPSTVRYHQDSQDSFVLCQDGGRNTIIRVDTGADQCDPSWVEEEELQVYSGGNNPSCTNTPTLQVCGDLGTNCQPHDIAYDQYSAPGWLFLTLSPRIQYDDDEALPRGQVLAIDADNLSDQFLFYRDRNGDYDPIELDLLPSSPPE